MEDQAARTPQRARTLRHVRRRTRPAPGRAHVEWSPDQINTFPSGPVEPRLVGQHGGVEVDNTALRYLYHGGFGPWGFFRPQTRMSQRS